MKKRTDLLLLLPSLAGFLAFYVIPFAGSFVYAFTENSFTMKFVGFENFRLLFGNATFRLAMKNMARFTLLAVPLTMVLSLLLALLTARFAARLSYSSHIETENYSFT